MTEELKAKIDKYVKDTCVYYRSTHEDMLPNQFEKYLRSACVHFITEETKELQNKLEMLDFFYEGNGFKRRGLNNSIQIVEYIEKLEKENKNYQDFYEKTKKEVQEGNHEWIETLEKNELLNERLGETASKLVTLQETLKEAKKIIKEYIFCTKGLFEDSYPELVKTARDFIKEDA